MTVAPDIDPYLLPLPTPASPVVLPHLAVAVHAVLNGRYADQVWSLAPLTGNPSAVKLRIRWERWPAAFREEMRLAAWHLINGEARPTLLQAHGARMRGRVSMMHVYGTLHNWRRFAEWLEGRGIRSLADCSMDVLHDYGQHVLEAGRRREYTLGILLSLTRLWAFDQLSARRSGIGRPPWEELGVEGYLPATTAARGGENSTEPVAEQTMGPLLIWAMRVVEDLSADIFAAQAERQRIIEAARAAVPTPEGRAALKAYFRPLLAGQAPVPSFRMKAQVFLNRTYVSGITGAAPAQVRAFVDREGLATVAAERPGPCPLDVPVAGRIDGRPWRDSLDFTEVSVLMRHLGTAAFIVCAYLTGMRPQEILGLRTGCCPDPGQLGRHLIRGREFKTATDEYGNYLPSGAERDVPWVAVTPVVAAIRVLERMVPAGHLLFDYSIHDPHGRAGTGSLNVEAFTKRIGDFTAWVNSEAARLGIPAEAIPNDPHGKVTASRFRRTLAWHIARRPNGLVALAIQYGHMRTNFQWASEGYGSRNRDGIHDLIDLETARAVADTVAALHDDLENSGGVSGPAARRAIRAAATAPRFVGTPITLASARKLLRNEDAMIYDNPHALVLCHHKRDKALCHRDEVRDTPSLDRCVPGCGNIARTDQQAAQLRERAAVLERQAAHVPEPVGDRMRASAARLREQADKHYRTRIITADEPA
jgi:integrase